MQIRRKARLCVVFVSLAIVVSFASILVSTRFDTEPFSRKYFLDQSSKFFVVGDVRRVLNGDLTASSYFNQSTSNVFAAFGAGAFGSVTRTGEMLVLDGKAYVKSSDRATNYGMGVSNEVMTPFSVGMARGVTPAAVYVLDSNGEKKYTVDLIYQTLSEKHGRLFAVFGIGQFTEIGLSAIKMAPLYGDSLLDPANKAKYFHNLSPIISRVGIFFGVVNNPSKEPPVGYDTNIEDRIFYVNPNDRGSQAIQSHTHILITANQTIDYGTTYSAGTILSMARSLPIVDVYHLLTQSLMKKAIVAVYDLSSAVSLSKGSNIETNTSIISVPSISQITLSFNIQAICCEIFDNCRARR
jgi:hypothetical protein